MSRYIEKGGTLDAISWAAMRQATHGDVDWCFDGELFGGKWERWTDRPPKLTSSPNVYYFRIEAEPRHLHELVDREPGASSDD